MSAQTLTPPYRPDFVLRTACPACDMRRATTIAAYPYDQPPLSSFLLRYYQGRADPACLAGIEYRLLRCSCCGLAYQAYVPTGALLSSVYNEWLPAAEREILRDSYSLDDYRYRATEVDFLLQHFGGHPARPEVFDFGFGWGEWAQMAAAYGCNVAGSELSPERVNHARSLGIEVIDWNDIPSREFDFINTEQVFEHLGDPFTILTHLVKGLRRGGILKISVPDCRNIDRAVAHMSSQEQWEGPPLMQIHPIEHLNAFTYHALTVLGERAGLRPIRPSLHHLWNASNGWLSPKLAARNVFRPIFRFLYPRSTYVYFTHGSPVGRTRKTSWAA